MVVLWMRDGVSLDPASPILPTVPTSSTGNVQHRMSHKQQEWLEEEVARLVRTGALEEVATIGSQTISPDKIAFVSPIFLVPKKGPKRWRLVVDMRRLNQHFVTPAFKLEGLGTILRMSDKGWWFVTFDLREGYFHLTIAETSRRWLGIRVGNKLLRYMVLPFGLSLSPWIFSKAMRQVITHWRRKGLFVTNYLDDFVIMAPTKEAAIAARAIVEADLERLGLSREPTKGSWEPSQRVHVLGLIIDSARGTVEVPQDKIEEAKDLLKQLCTKETTPARTMATVAGKLISFSRAFLPARLYTRSLFSAIDAMHRRPWEWDRPVQISAQIKSDAQWILNNLDRFNGAAGWKPPHMIRIYTDASNTGWGAVLGRRSTRGGWTIEEVERSINWKELTAVHRALQAFAHLVRGRFILLLTDSRVAEAYLRNGGGREPHLTERARSIWELCVEMDCVISEVE